MIRVIFNEIGRERDRADVKVTFIDESGNGIARIRVTDAFGEVILGPEEPEPRCQRTVSREIRDIMLDRFHILASSSECGGDDSGSDTDHYPYNETWDLRSVIPIDPDENPCSIPFATRRDEGTPCWHGIQNVNGIAAEIEDLCEELDRHRQDWNHHSTRESAYGLGATIAFFASIAAAIIATRVPWPVNLIFGIIAGALFAASLVLGSLMAYHRDQARRARSNMDEVEARLEEARDRYRRAVEDAIRGCCGMVPELEIDPPTCE